MGFIRLFIAVLVIIFPVILSAAEEAGGAIRFGVSPIRHELSIIPGESKSETVKFINNSDTPYFIYVTTEDCNTDSDFGTPKCVSGNPTNPDPNKLSSWVRLPDVRSFTVPPKGEKIVPFTIEAPLNAAPGGYYGAIFFTNPNDDGTSGGNVGQIRRIAVLLLVKVEGDIVIDTKLKDVLIEGAGGAGGNPSSSYNILKTLLLSPLDKDNLGKLGTLLTEELDPFTSAPKEEKKSKKKFRVNFRIPVTNNGNIHVKPTGKIMLYDEKGFQLAKVGKQTIVSPEGAFLDEKIVDFLPINDEQGNVLPKTARIFTTEWIGFPYERASDDGKKVIIDYMTPDEYFSDKESILSLYPWERIRSIERDRTLKAQIEVSYPESVGKIGTRKYTKDVRIQYVERSKGLHYGRILIALFILWIIFLILRRRNKRIEELETLLRVDEASNGKIARRKSSTNNTKILDENTEAIGTRNRRIIKTANAGTKEASAKRQKPRGSSSTSEDQKKD